MGIGRADLKSVMERSWASWSQSKVGQREREFLAFRLRTNEIFPGKPRIPLCCELAHHRAWHPHGKGRSVGPHLILDALISIRGLLIN